jgi:transcriptional regulator with GAF, ATPase, and Fis domain
MDAAHEARIRSHRHAAALNKAIGTTLAFRRAIDTVAVAAKSDATVLICGETGTGKELVARSVHYLSERAGQPFVAVNCGSLTDTLLEDEIFGHERGAFTDAQQRRQGLLAQAGSGTLFLDEVDTLTGRGQVALLRVLQDHVYRPLGSQHECCSEARFVAATNARLAEMVEAGAFRADLYYRLCVFTVVLPPLRDRGEDILPLASHFLDKHAPADRPQPVLSAAACDALLSYAWPGNVRELENAMIRAARLTETGTIETDHLVLPLTTVSSSGEEPTTYQAMKTNAIRQFERDYLNRVMRQAGGSITRAAQIAGKDRRDMGRLLKRHGLAGLLPTPG